MNKLFKSLEHIVENLLWLLRFATIVPVFFSAINVLILFYVGSREVLDGLQTLAHMRNEETEKMLPVMMSGVIGGIDTYLIGIVMLLFSYGIYELFISKIDIGRRENTEVQLLTITSLDQLKDKILKVVIMAMIVGFFKRMIELKVSSFQDIILLAISILLISASAYLLKMNSKQH